MKIEGWSPEELEQLKRKEQRIKRWSSIFLASLVPMLLANHILDRVLSVVFRSNYAAYEHVPPYFPIWVVVGTTWMLFVFSIVWRYWEARSKWVRVSLVAALIVYVCGMLTAVEMGFLESHGTTFWEFMPVLWVLSIALFLGAFTLSVKAKTLGAKIAVITFFLVLFVVVHWGFYLPMFPDFSWIGVDPVFSLTDPMVTLITIMSGSAIVVMIGMGILQSDKIRVKIVAEDMEKHIARRRKKEKTP